MPKKDGSGVHRRCLAGAVVSVVPGLWKKAARMFKKRDHRIKIIGQNGIEAEIVLRNVSNYEDVERGVSDYLEYEKYVYNTLENTSIGGDRIDKFQSPHADFTFTIGGKEVAVEAAKSVSNVNSIGLESYLSSSPKIERLVLVTEDAAMRDPEITKLKEKYPALSIVEFKSGDTASNLESAIRQSVDASKST